MALTIRRIVPLFTEMQSVQLVTECLTATAATYTDRALLSLIETRNLPSRLLTLRITRITVTSLTFRRCVQSVSAELHLGLRRELHSRQRPTSSSSFSVNTSVHPGNSRSLRLAGPGRVGGGARWSVGGGGMKDQLERDEHHQ